MTKKSILITGGTGKLGRVLIKHFLKKGWQISFTSRNIENINALISEVNDEFLMGNIYGFEIDLQEEGASIKLLKALNDKNVSITHLINNARSLDNLEINSSGVASRHKFLQELGLGVVLPYELSIELLNSDNHNLVNIVNIGSMYGIVAPNPQLYNGTLSKSPIQYGVGKAGLHHLTKEMAVRFSERNVRVNCVAFGGVEGRQDDSFLQRYQILCPARRMLKESEVLGPIEFLLDEMSSAVNGHTLIADGGWSLW